MCYNSDLSSVCIFEGSGIQHWKFRWRIPMMESQRKAAVTKYAVPLSIRAVFQIGYDGNLQRIVWYYQKISSTSVLLIASPVGRPTGTMTKTYLDLVRECDR